MWFQQGNKGLEGQEGVFRDSEPLDERLCMWIETICIF